MAYSDLDLDGVDDAIDKCPGTPITDIVDENGCSVETVIRDGYFDTLFSIAYSDMNYRLNEKSDTVTASFQLGYSTGRLQLRAYLSYFRTDDSFGDRQSGLNDTLLSAAYRWSLDETVVLDTGFGVWLPTYRSDFDNNKMDYTLFAKVTKSIKEWSLFLGYGYTFVMDDDVVKKRFALLYRNSASIEAGIRWRVLPSLSVQTAYYRTDSIYKDVEAIRSLSFSLLYSFGESWFIKSGYEMGLSDSASDNYLSVGVGTVF